jgi:ATP-binding protein involved in chromosome partitioning
MSGYACPHCGRDLPLFKSGGGLKTAQAAKVPFLGALPFDPTVVEASDKGELLQVKEADSPFFQAFTPIVDYILETLPATPLVRREPGVMKFALPVDDGKLSDKFGHASQFAIFTVKDGAVGPKELLPAPPHESGGIPEWLDDLGITHVIAGTLGEKAQGLLTKKGIEVLAGAPLEAPEALVEKYLNQTLTVSPREHPGGCSQCSTA